MGRARTFLLAAAALTLAAPAGADELASGEWPLWVEYDPGDEALARAVLAAAEGAWVRLAELGYPTPWTEDPAGAPVTGMRFAVTATGMGADGAMAEWLSDVPGTELCDCAARVLIDRATSTESPLLAEGVLHELVHTCQYARECTEAPTVYEAFVLAGLFHERPDSPVVAFGLRQFQLFPSYPVDYFTMAMPCSGLTPCFGYVLGAGLFPLFLIDRYAAGDPTALPALFATFGQIGEVRVGPPHPTCLPANDPDWLAATDAWLRVRGADLESALAEFACARFVTGAHDDGGHFTRGADIPEPPLARVHALLPAEGGLGLYELASAAVALPAPAPDGLRLSLAADAAATWSASLLVWRDGQGVERRVLLPAGAEVDTEVPPLPDAARLLLVVAQFHDGRHDPDDMDYSQLRRISYRVEGLPPADGGQEDGSGDGDHEAQPEGCGCVSTGLDAGLGMWIMGFLFLWGRSWRTKGR